MNFLLSWLLMSLISFWNSRTLLTYRNGNKPVSQGYNRKIKYHVLFLKKDFFKNRFITLLEKFRSLINLDYACDWYTWMNFQYFTNLLKTSPLKVTRIKFYLIRVKIMVNREFIHKSCDYQQRNMLNLI
jgi:hypothetical protein